VSKKIGKQPAEAHATGFLRRAREFLNAADREFTSEDNHTPVRKWHPALFLYAQALELALKAFLRTRDVKVEKTYKHHDYVKLYEAARQFGFTMGPDEQHQIGNIVRALRSANKNQGLRYFIDFETATMVDLGWVREVVTQLVTTVEPSVTEYEEKHPSGSGKLSGVFLVWGKPTKNSTNP
jgi:HEPN domain-containing protein